jgi:hypothetical protein
MGSDRWNGVHRRTKGDSVIAPTIVHAGLYDNDEYTVPTAWHILEELFAHGRFSEPVDLNRLAVTQAGMRELPLEVRQAWGKALIEAASLFRRTFMM